MSEVGEEEIRLNHDSMERLEVGGDADASEEPIIDETEGNFEKRAFKKGRGTVAGYWAGYEKYLDADNKRRARCLYCGKTYASDSSKNGTKNVKNHFSACKKNPANMEKGNQSQIIFEHTSGDIGSSMSMKNWSYDGNVVREAIVEMVIKDEMSFTCVEKDGLRNAFFAACPLLFNV